MALSSKIAYFYKLSDAVEEVSGNSLTDNGSVTFAAGKIGNGAVGNGSSKSLYGTVSAANVPTTEYHRWCWVNVDHPLDGGGATPLFAPYAKWDGGGDFIFTVWDDGHIDFSNVTGGGVYSTTLLSPNTWHLIHGWWDGTNFNVQIDNNTADSASGSTPSSNSSALSILAQQGGFGSYFSGMVDAAGGSNVAWDAGDYTELWSGGAGYEFTYTPPNVTLSASSATVAENGGTATVTATLSESATREATVDLSLSGTATGGGVDYTIDTTTITVPVGQSTAAATITAVNNAAVEANKTIIVDIDTTANATESGTQQVTITIVDDDGITSTLTIAAFCDEDDMQQAFQLNQNSTAMTFAMRSSTSGLLVTGLTPTVRLSKNGGAFAAAAGAVGEMSLGWYSVAPSATDFDTLGPLKLLSTAANCITTVRDYMVIGYSPTVGLPSIAPGLSGGLLVGSGTGTVVLTTGGVASANVTTWNGTAVATPATAGHPVVTVKVGTGTGELSLSSGVVRAADASGANVATSTALATAQTSINTIAGYLDTEVAAIKAKTDNLPVSPASVSDIPTAANIAATVAAQITSDHGSGSYTTANVAGLATSTDLSTAQSGITAIKAKTDNLPSSPANVSDIPTTSAITSAVAAQISTDHGSGNYATATALATAQSSINTLATTSQLASSSATLLAAIPSISTLATTSQLAASSAALLTQVNLAIATSAAILDDTGTSGVVVAAASKTGYGLASDGLDSISTTAPSGVATNFRQMVVQTWRRLFKKTTLTSTQLKTYADDGSTVVTTQAVTNTGGTETVGNAS